MRRQKPVKVSFILLSLPAADNTSMPRNFWHCTVQHDLPFAIYVTTLGLSWHVMLKKLLVMHADSVYAVKKEQHVPAL